MIVLVMEYAVRKLEFVNVGNRLMDSIVQDYDVQKIVEPTVFVIMGDVNAVRNGLVRIAKRPFVNQIIAIITEFAT